MASCSFIHAGQGGRGEGSQVLAAVTRSPGEMVVVVVSLSSGTAPLRSGAFPEKEIDVLGSSCATAGDFAEAIRLVAANRPALAPVFSHHFPLARAAEAFAFAMSRSPDAIKIVVTVN
jgi:threonine dehydrogenase-like Zn-dependent dehydrogenase